MSRKVTWMGSKECDFCGDYLPTDRRGWFVNGATGQGPWAVMCSSCYNIYGQGLGIGRGQRYDSKTFEKVEG